MSTRRLAGCACLPAGRSRRCRFPSSCGSWIRPRPASRALSALGLAPDRSVVDGTVVRMAKAYPVYEGGYLDALETLKQYLARFSNLQPIGRNGLHKYNNQDHSMLTALLAVENMLGASHDIWAVNADDEYYEDVSDQAGELTAHARALAGTQPLVPREIGVAFRERRRF